LAAEIPEGEYELIIAGDVIEHMDKPDAEVVLDTLYEKATKAMLVNIPIGTNWDHPICHGNSAELHRSEWSVEDFYPFPNVSQLFDINTLGYGVFYCPKDVTEDQCWRGIHEAAMAAESRREYDVAARFLERGLKRFPGDESTVLRLATAYANLGRIDDALHIVSDAIVNNPNFWHGHLIKATILKSAKRKDEALAELMGVLEQSAIEDGLRGRAQSMFDELSSA
jgi:tetratricopeptide (TPR) repeat protein